MASIIRLFVRGVSSERFDYRMGEIALSIAAIVIIVCGVHALAVFNLTGGQYLLGLIGILNLAFSCIVLVNVMGLRVRGDSKQEE